MEHRQAWRPPTKSNNEAVITAAVDIHTKQRIIEATHRRQMTISSLVRFYITAGLDLDDALSDPEIGATAATIVANETTP